MDTQQIDEYDNLFYYSIGNYYHQYEDIKYYLAINQVITKQKKKLNI